MIDSLFLDNYKHFEAFKLDSLKRINIISGQNNTGKTSILEALFLLHDRASVDTTLKQCAWRGINSIDMTPSSLWQPMFKDFDLGKKVTIKISDSGHDETAEYKHINNFNSTVVLQNQNQNQNLNINSSGGSLTEALQSKFTRNKKPAGETNLFINAGQISLNHKSLSPAKRMASFIQSSAKGNNQHDAEKLGRIDIEFGLNKITEKLKIIEPRLKGLSIVPNAQQSLVYGDIGLKRKVPISYMGEGVMKLLSILVTIATSPNSIILCDEIENGIHYSLFPKIWEIIEEMTLEFNSQLFTTTHSYDALIGLSTYYNKSKTENFSYTRLDWVDNKVVPKSFSTEMLASSLDRNWEVR